MKISNKFTKIEDSLELLSSIDSDLNSKKELEDFFKAICESLNISGSDPDYQLFSKQTSNSQKEVIAAWVL